MRIAQIGTSLVLALLCIGLQAETLAQKIAVTGTLTRVMAIGGESTGWTIQTESEIAVDGKQVNSVEVGYPDVTKLEKLANKRVKATGKISHRHGVETGDQLVLEVSSIKEAKAK
jgi:hypothetical protein